MTLKLSRNGICPCGSGRKYKRCCLVADEALGGTLSPSMVDSYETGPTFTFSVIGPDPGGNAAAVAERVSSYKMSMFEHWLDDPRPDFGGLSARQAAHEPRFYRILLSEIEFMEKAEDTMVAPESRMDLAFLRKALGFAPASLIC